VLYIAIDFDNTVVVERGRAYDDVTTPLAFLPGAKPALESLKRAGHKLLLWSGRSSPALIKDPKLDPLVKAGVKPENRDEWEKRRHIHIARHQQMLAFVTVQLPGIFDAIDDGHGGKPLVHIFIDDKALRMVPGGWRDVATTYGDTPLVDAHPHYTRPRATQARVERLLGLPKKQDDEPFDI
jgi:hypothetical protein